jgi:uncharacterized protein (TIGR03435 family)
MERFARTLGIRRKLLLSAAGLLAATVPAVIGAVSVSPQQPQAQTQTSASAGSTTYEYEVAIIKPSKPGGNGVGLLPAPDGLIARYATLQMLVTAAYGIENYQLSGAPSWLTSDQYDIDAKMEASVADALQKLSPDQRRIARQRMLQALLADRFKLTIRRETSELPVYSLVIAKSGSKLKQATPGDTYQNGLHDVSGHARGAGATMIGVNAGALTFTGQGVPVATLIKLLATHVDRTIVDRTGLAGNFDFFLQFTAN